VAEPWTIEIEDSLLVCNIHAMKPGIYPTGVMVNAGMSCVSDQQRGIRMSSLPEPNFYN
jgi:hypothetical protein